MPDPTVDRFAQCLAPAHWQAVDFISDLHLHSADPETFATLRRYLQAPPAERASALFILGDLFEVWVGDDALGACRAWGAESEKRPQRGQFLPDLPPHSPAMGQEAGKKWTAAAALQPALPKSDRLLEPQPDDAQQPERAFLREAIALLRAHSRHTPTFFLAGNRDFLLGPDALTQAGMTRLSDPTVLHFLGQRWLLSHGDAMCLEDTDYQRFRQEVRSPDWQRAFLARPVAEREALAGDMRARSEARKHALGNDPALWADVDATAARQALQRAGAHTLIHGHTHRPAEHALGFDEHGQALQRVVLSDWDARAHPPRAEVLRLDARGLNRLPLGTMCPA